MTIANGPLHPQAVSRSYYSEDLREECHGPLSVMVIETGGVAEPIGIIDRHGRDICRVKDRPGFMRY